MRTTTKSLANALRVLNTRMLAAASFAFLLFAFGQSKAQEKPELDFLLGTWHIPQMNLYETWEKAENGEGYSGKAVARLSEGERLFETFEVHRVDGQWVYTVQVQGQEAVDFDITEWSDGRVVFENPEHDLPSRITYTIDPGGSNVRLEGSEGDEQIEYNYDYIPESGAAADAMAASNTYAHISIGTEDLAANVAFYKKLGFKMLAQDNAPWPWVLLSDGAVNVQLNMDGMTYFGVSVFGQQAARKRAEQAKAAGAIPMMELSSPAPNTIFVDPDSIFGLGFIAFDIPHAMPKKGNEGKLGAFGEIAIPVTHYDSAKAWYGMVGYKSTGDNTVPYPWGIVSDGAINLGLHQSTHFDKPALTYFSSNAPERIEALQAEGVEVQNAIPGAGNGPIQNGVATSPDGWPVFIFQGDF